MNENSRIEDPSMKQDRMIAPTQDAPPTDRLMSLAYRGLAPLVRELRTVDEALEQLLKVGDADAEPAIRDLRRQIRAFEPSVTMIGQVKAGKTSLVNAMVGRPGLLPADINPWTSVITSLHVSPRIRESAQHAKFRFFSEEEWSNLLNRGGRVGELARRAGADKELETVRAQLEEMREKSRQRLGKSFELLLGQEHDYGYVDPELVERYVCLGDDVDPTMEPDNGQGRFADITKSAELYLSQRGLVWPMCVRDTPGVNDTFLVREQITVNAIRSSRVCVVVLSAHQALSTVDMALIRMIAKHPRPRRHHLRQPHRRVGRSGPRDPRDPRQHPRDAASPERARRRHHPVRQRPLGDARAGRGLGRTGRGQCPGAGADGRARGPWRVGGQQRRGRHLAAFGPAGAGPGHLGTDHSGRRP